MRPLHITNARIWDGETWQQRDLFCAENITATPSPGALQINLDGHSILPGFVNAHDHLELNHYPRTRPREHYDSAHHWGDDLNARLDSPPFSSLRAYPLGDRLFIGGLKNLLCGATTVIHHNPPHRALYGRDFPARVLRRYGWAHSLHFNTEDEIRRSYRRTPRDTPWFIHLAEGTDAAAAAEYRQLKSLGCGGDNTIIIHGVGVSEQDIADAAPSLRGLVWCPSTNLYLLGQTADVRAWLSAGGQLALGSDSRLTADGDLLDEIDAARAILNATEIMTALYSGARIAGINAGHLRPGAPADFIVVTSADGHLLNSCGSRSALGLVVRGSIPQIGDPHLIKLFPHIQTIPALLDGVPKLINIHLARQIMRCGLWESGLELKAVPPRRWRQFAHLFDVRPTKRFNKE